MRPRTRSPSKARNPGCLLLLALAGSHAFATSKYEEPGSIRLADTVPEVLIAGADGMIKDPAGNDGMLNTYVVTAPQGEFEVTTTHGLCKLVREVNAIAQIAAVDKSDLFSDSAVEAVKDLGRGAKYVATNPGTAFKNAARGVGEVFRDLGDRITKGSERSEVEDSTFEKLIRFSKVKRQFGYDFGVDVYSNNEVLQEYLDKISWAAFSGGMTFQVASSLATAGVAGAAISITNATTGFESVLRDNSPRDLRELTRKMLTEQGLSEDLINLFIRNDELSPRHQLYMVGALDLMKGVEGREHLIRRAANARSYEEGFDRQVQAQLFAHIDAERSLVRFVPIGDLRVVAQAEDGTLFIATTVDHLIWTRNLEQLMKYKNERIAEQKLSGDRELWLTGTVSDEAQKGLAELGWKVRPRLVDEYVGRQCNPTVPVVKLTEDPIE